MVSSIFHCAFLFEYKPRYCILDITSLEHMQNENSKCLGHPTHHISRFIGLLLHKIYLLRKSVGYDIWSFVGMS